jgi:ribonucleotide monophosphatase NagD (HAD superfamily)
MGVNRNMHAQYPADCDVRAARMPDGHGLSDAALCDASGIAGDRFIIRLDGIVFGHGGARPDASNWLRSLAGRFVLVSSNSRDTARTMAAKLRRAGLDVPEQRIVLAGEEALRLAAGQHPGARCKVQASRVLAHAARNHGLELVQDNAEVILLGRDSAWTYRDLALVVHELARGARLIASNDDMTCIGQGGRPIPDTGAILASIEAAAGQAAGIIRLPRAAVLRAAQLRLGDAGCAALVISHQDADRDAAQGIAGLRWVRFDPDAGDAPAGLAARSGSLAGAARHLSGPCAATVAAPQ